MYSDAAFVRAITPRDVPQRRKVEKHSCALPLSYTLARDGIRTRNLRFQCSSSGIRSGPSRPFSVHGRRRHRAVTMIPIKTDEARRSTHRPGSRRPPRDEDWRNVFTRLVHSTTAPKSVAGSRRWSRRDSNPHLVHSKHVVPPGIHGSEATQSLALPRQSFRWFTRQTTTSARVASRRERRGGVRTHTATMYSRPAFVCRLPFARPKPTSHFDETAHGKM